MGGEVCESEGVDAGDGADDEGVVGGYGRVDEGLVVLCEVGEVYV